MLYSIYLVRPVKLQHIFKFLLEQDLFPEMCNRIPSSELSVFCKDDDLWDNCAYKCQKRFPNSRGICRYLFIFKKCNVLYMQYLILLIYGKIYTTQN